MLRALETSHSNGDREDVRILPTPGRSSVTSSGSVAGTAAPAGYAPVTTGAS